MLIRPFESQLFGSITWRSYFSTNFFCKTILIFNININITNRAITICIRHKWFLYDLWRQKSQWCSHDKCASALCVILSMRQIVVWWGHNVHIIPTQSQSLVWTYESDVPLPQCPIILGWIGLNLISWATGSYLVSWALQLKRCKVVHIEITNGRVILNQTMQQEVLFSLVNLLRKQSATNMNTYD